MEDIYYTTKKFQAFYYFCVILTWNFCLFFYLLKEISAYFLLLQLVRRRNMKLDSEFPFPLLSLHPIVRVMAILFSWCLFLCISCILRGTFPKVRQLPQWQHLWPFFCQALYLQTEWSYFFSLRLKTQQCPGTPSMSKSWPRHQQLLQCGIVCEDYIVMWWGRWQYIEEMLFNNVKEKSFSPSSLWLGREMVSVGLSGELHLGKLEMLCEFVRLALQLGGWLCGLPGMCRMRLISFPTWSPWKGHKKNVIHIVWENQWSSGG